MEEETKKEFKQFDIVTGCSDHHFYSNTGKFSSNNVFSNANSQVCKNIMKEWSILEKNLPETIFVRVYEERIDLLRAAIIGANGTPYHDNVFFFDIKFPTNYPSTPPSVYYRSHGLRINPNLYRCGYVCLSLLNTWDGKKQERWVASESSILQVLISIQGLVLNEKPYFNEPGVKDTGHNWQQYNKNAFILSCKTMLFTLRNPPKNFEDFVSEFFRQRASIVVKACDDYMSGRAIIGYSSVTNASVEVHVAEEFKRDLNKIYKQLVKKFEEEKYYIRPSISKKCLDVNVMVKPKSKFRVSWLSCPKF